MRDMVAWRAALMELICPRSDFLGRCQWLPFDPSSPGLDAVGGADCVPKAPQTVRYELGPGREMPELGAPSAQLALDRGIGPATARSRGHGHGEEA
jgi:hypothetical protein